MADYYSHPLWEATPGVVGNIDPSDLPISKELQQALRVWADEFDDTLDLDNPAASDFESVEAKAIFKKRGHELGEWLERQLGPSFTVIVKV